MANKQTTTRSGTAAAAKATDKKKKAASAGKKAPAQKGTGGGKKTTSKSKGGDATSEQDAVDWDKDDHKLSMSLMTAITDDKAVEDALFPKVGPNPSTKSGGGKPKTDHYWELCKTLFTDHPEYGTAFAPALEGDKSERKVWTTKIKNRLRRMVTVVNKARKTLGKTGEGIKYETDITDELSVEFRNKWEEVKSKCPYFFVLRDLIAERPNHIPTGLGNSESAIDLDVMCGNEPEESLMDLGEDDIGEMEGGPGRDSEEDSENEDEAEGRDGEDAGDGSAGESDSEIKITVGQKRKAATSKSSGKGKTSARPATSTPAKTSAQRPKKFKAALAFEELAKSEEKTRQKELDLEAEKWRFNTEKLKAKLEHKRLELEVLRLKVEARKMETATASPPVPYDPFQFGFGASGSASQSHTPLATFTGDLNFSMGSTEAEAAL